MIDLTQQRPPFADACWSADKTMCQWCGGTGHVAGDPDGELCKCPDLVAQSCECGEPECLGDAKWFAEATADIAMQLAEQAPGLDSPLLRLVKERNEARELVKRVLYTSHLGDDSQDKFDALADAHKAVFQWKGGAK
jgi:hypothetical protein